MIVGGGWGYSLQVNFEMGEVIHCSVLVVLNEESANKRIRKLRAGLLAQGAYKKRWPGRKWVLELENGASCFK